MKNRKAISLLFFIPMFWACTVHTNDEPKQVTEVQADNGVQTKDTEAEKTTQNNQWPSEGTKLAGDVLFSKDDWIIAGNGISYRTFLTLYKDGSYEKMKTFTPGETLIYESGLFIGNPTDIGSELTLYADTCSEIVYSDYKRKYVQKESHSVQKKELFTVSNGRHKDSVFETIVLGDGYTISWYKK